MKKLIWLFAVILAFTSVNAQTENDKGIFKEYTPGYYYNVIMKDIQGEKEVIVPARPKQFKMDMTGKVYPSKLDMYKSKVWHNKPVSQGNTGSCWCFASTSFFEAEIKRITDREVKLSEMYVVYWEYVEKAKRFIQQKGNSLFAQGSEGNAVNRIYKKYGIVPYSKYTGLKAGKKFYNHSEMFKEMNSYLKYVKTNNYWNEEVAIETIKNILNLHMGKPPETINLGGKDYTPIQYLREELKLDVDEYVDILSYMQKPYFNQVEYEVPDNWWLDTTYYNVPLDDFMRVVKNAIKRGYSISIGGDISEAGFCTDKQVAVVPSFDLATADINEYSRQSRFSRGSTTDDHGMHLVGFYTDFETNKLWFLVKDSGSGSRNNGIEKKEFGYYFFQEDYVKLKIMDFMIHKSAVTDLLSKFTK